MTNEEIVKRFKFDLNVAFHSTFSSNFCYIDITKSVFSNEVDYKKTLKLIAVLEELGYTNARFINKRRCNLVFINKIDKSYIVMTRYDGRKVERNEYPDYLLEYKLQGDEEESGII